MRKLRIFKSQRLNRSVAGNGLLFFLMGIFGVLMALVVWLEETLGHRIERKAGCEGCPSAQACQGKECEG